MGSDAWNYWGHRVMRQLLDHGGVTFAVHEVYYDADGAVVTQTKDAVAPHFNETTDPDWSLRKDFGRQMKALDLPILDHATGKEIEG